MGDPRKPRKKFKTPNHPWEKERIEEEAVLIKEYGLKNKTEIQKMDSVLRNLKAQAKRYIASTSEQAEKEKNALIKKIQRIGISETAVSMDEILGLDIKAIMERRLQTLIYRKGFARTIKQARQMITHRHVSVNGRKITSPARIITKEEETNISFHENSSFRDPEHPERPKTDTKKEAKE